MPLLQFVWDLTGKRFVLSLLNSGTFQLPDIHQEDIWSFLITPGQRISLTQAPFYSAFNIADYALRISVGSVGTVNARQTVWDKIDDAQFSGTLDFNTANMNALADGTPQIIEARLIGPEIFQTQQQVTFKKIVDPTGAVAPLVGDRYIGANEADQRYLRPRLNPGEAITLVSADESKEASIYLGNDGMLYGPPIVPI